MFRKSVKKHERLFTTLVLVLSFYQQFLLYTTYYDLIGLNLSDSLPLHISRFNALLAVIYLLSNDEGVFKLLAYFSLYAWISLIYPIRVYSIVHPIGVSYLLSYFITSLLPFYGFLIHDNAIEKGDKNKIYPWFILYLFVAYLVNLMVDGNYFYLTHRPLLDFLPDLIYIPLVLVFTYGLFSLGEKIYLKVQNRV
ncbi:hypothetical protein [Alkalibacterium subtropicum]|uniref:TMEM164 family acyltransferase n=1 Tax=Alkalibacterium subtropicum TaxID=753702 RepID=UPI0031841D42